MVNRRRKRPGRWISRLWRGLMAGAVLGVLGVVALQALMTTGWARAQVAAKLEARIGLPVAVEGVSWWPWSGVVLRGMRVGQPEALRGVMKEDLVRVEELRVWPDYAAALLGKRKAVGVEVVGPQVMVSVEMLISIASQALGEPPAVPPVAVVPKVPAGTIPEPAVASSQGAGVAPGVGVVSKPSVVGKKVGKGGGKEGQPEEEAVELESRWLVVREGSLRVMWAAEGQELVGMEGLAMAVAYQSDGDSGGISLDQLRLANRSIKTNVTGRVSSGLEGVRVSIQDFPENSEQVVFDLQILKKRGLPFQGRFGVKGGGGIGLNWGGNQEVKSASLLVEGAIGGWLQAPGSWHGSGRLQGTKLGIQVAGQAMTFDEGGVQVSLRNGQLEVPDARLVGEQLSLLGNGRLDRLEGAGVLRVVVPPSAAAPIMAMAAAKLDGEVRMDFHPFDPPDRWYVDLRAWRSPEGWRLRLGERGSEVALEGLRAAFGP